MVGFIDSMDLGSLETLFVTLSEVADAATTFNTIESNTSTAPSPSNWILLIAEQYFTYLNGL